MIPPFSTFRRIWHPEAYHPGRNHRSTFQGWFFKLVDADRENVIAVIPGIFLNRSPRDSRAFIQILNGRNHQSTYHAFPSDQFRAAGDRLDIRIGDNHFSEDGIRLNLSTDQLEIKGKIGFGKFNPWPVTLFSPGVMGYYAFVPFMQCYHGIISLTHELQGEIAVNGEQMIFDGGRGYIEDDWGRSFPEAYVWMQSNHFSEEGTSLAVSVARIPWLGSYFRGFLIGLLWKGKLYRFTTYSGARLTGLSRKNKEISLAVSDKQYELRIKSFMGNMGELRAPGENQVIQRVSESLDSAISVELFSIENGKNELLYRDRGHPAGSEANGKVELLFDADG